MFHTFRILKYTACINIEMGTIFIDKSPAHPSEICPSHFSNRESLNIIKKHSYFPSFCHKILWAIQPPLTECPTAIQQHRKTFISIQQKQQTIKNGYTKCLLCLAFALMFLWPQPICVVSIANSASTQ